MKKCKITKITLILLILITLLPNGCCADSGPDLELLNMHINHERTHTTINPHMKTAEGFISVTNTIKNAGDTATSTYYIEYYLTGDNVTTYPGIKIGESVGVNLGAGEETTFTDSISLPSIVLPGKYYLLAVADLRYFAETNTNNNHIMDTDPIYLGSDQESDTHSIYGPTIIKLPGTYILKNDITGQGINYPIEIQASDVVLDGNHHTITGVNSRASCGVYVHFKQPLSNIIIRDLNVQNFGDGIWLYETRECTITDCEIKDNVDSGIRIDKSLNNVITGNTVTGNNPGIGAFNSGANIFYNNYLQNNYNVIMTENYINEWSTTEQPRENIVGGNTVGGNFWDNPDKTGFSNSVPDTDGDGIGDYPYSINADNIDYLPLKAQDKTEITPEPTVKAKEPKATVTPTPAPTPEGQRHTDSTGPELLISDIAVISINTTEKSSPGGEIKINTVLENQGTIKCEPFYAYYYISKDSKITPSDHFLKEERVPSIAPQESVNLSATYQVPLDFVLGRYYIGVIADSTRRIIESDEDNNTAVSTNPVTIK